MMWDRIYAVQKMQDYIEKHLFNPINLTELSKAAGYTPSHASRVFKEFVGISPIDYLRARRLSQAAKQVRDTPDRILDIALDTMFDSHEGFTRAFTRQFGINPEYYRKYAPPIPLFLSRSIRDYYLHHMKGVEKMVEKTNEKTIFVQIVERPARKLILQRAEKATHYFEYTEEVGCDVWGFLSSIKEALYEPIGMWLPDSLRLPNTSKYVQGIEVSVDYSGEVPNGMEIIDLKPCKMMIFHGQPYKDEEMVRAINEVWAAIDNYKPENYGYKWADEDGPRFQFAPLPERGYIEARPVRDIEKQ